MTKKQAQDDLQRAPAPGRRALLRGLAAAAAGLAALPVDALGQSLLVRPLRLQSGGEGQNTCPTTFTSSGSITYVGLRFGKTVTRTWTTPWDGPDGETAFPTTWNSVTGSISYTTTINVTASYTNWETRSLPSLVVADATVSAEGGVASWSKTEVWREAQQSITNAHTQHRPGTVTCDQGGGPDAPGGGSGGEAVSEVPVAAGPRDALSRPLLSASELDVADLSTRAATLHMPF